MNRRKQVHRIKLCKANLKRDLRSLSQMIPYVVAQMGGITKKSMIDQKGGKKPAWNQVLQFETQQSKIKLSVFDCGNFSDSLIGQGTFDLLSLPQNDNEGVVDLNYQNACIGKLYIKILSKQIQMMAYPKLQKNENQQQKMRFQGIASKLLQTPGKQQKYNPFDQLCANMVTSLIKNSQTQPTAPQITAASATYDQTSNSPKPFTSAPSAQQFVSPQPRNNYQYPQMNIPAQPQLYNQVPPNYAYNNQYNQMNTRYQIPQQNYPNIFQAPQNNYMYQQNNPQYSIPSRMIMQNVPNNQALTNRLNGTKYNNTAMTNSTKRADNLNEKSGIDGLIDSISSLF